MQMRQHLVEAKCDLGVYFEMRRALFKDLQVQGATINHHPLAWGTPCDVDQSVGGLPIGFIAAHKFSDNRAKIIDMAHLVMIHRLIGSDDAVEDNPLVEALGAIVVVLTAQGAEYARPERCRASLEAR